MGYRILCIDDEAIIRSLVGRVVELVSRDATVTHAVDGEQGIQEYERAKYDLVITDYSMPKKSGAEVIRAIRAHDPNIPIVLMSSRLGVIPEDVLQKTNAQLCKPIDIDALEGIIRKYFNGHQ